MYVKLLTENNHKILKGKAHGYLTFILHLAPAHLSGFNVCARASEGCKAACLNTAGRGCYAKTQNARIRKTRELFIHRAQFMAQLRWDIRAGIRRAKRLNLIPCFRLNGTSDLPWEVMAPELFREFSDIIFYDYTAIPHRFHMSRPANYHLTFSRKENNWQDCESVLKAGGNVAVVFSGTYQKHIWGTALCVVIIQIYDSLTLKVSLSDCPQKVGVRKMLAVSL